MTAPGSRPGSRRRVYACVTDAGRTLHAAAMPTHRAVLEATLAG